MRKCCHWLHCVRAALSVSGWGGGVRGQWVVRSVDSLMKLRGERGLLFPQQERSELGRDSGQVPGGHAEKWVPLTK